MKKALVTILIILVLVLALGIAGFVGYNWYRDNHVFVEGDAYDITLQSLDLTGEDITVAYYDELQAKLPDCNIRWMVPFQGSKYPDDTESLMISSLTVEDVEFVARYFPKLKKLTPASQDYDQYDMLAVAEAALPDMNTLPKVLMEDWISTLEIENRELCIPAGRPIRIILESCCL